MTRLAKFLSLFVCFLLTAEVSRGAQTYLQDISASGLGQAVVVATAAHPQDGSVYVLGRFVGGNLTLQNLPTLAPQGDTNTMFLAKLSANGSWLWMSRLTDDQYKGTLNARSLFVTRNNVYLCGETLLGLYYARTVAISGSQTTGELFPNGSTSLAPFVLKLDTDGRFVWGAVAYNNEVQSGAPGFTADAYGNDIAVDGNDNVFVCGSFRSAIIEDASSAKGLNFGSYHAFRARDTSGYPGGGADWTVVTRDGFTAKLNQGGSWQWVVTGGGLEDGSNGGFVSISANDQSEVYVTGNGQGGFSQNGLLMNKTMTAAIWNADFKNGGGIPPTAAFTNNCVGMKGDNTGVIRAWVGKIGGSGQNDGRWAGVYAVSDNQQVLGTTETRARGVLWAGGVVYSVYYDVTAKDLFIVKMDGALASIDSTAAASIVGPSGVNDVSLGRCLNSDLANNVYISGVFGSPQATFNGGASTTRFVTSGQAVFAGKLNSNLNWQWVTNTTQLSGSIPGWGPVAGTVDPQTGTYFLSSSFTNGILDFGPPSSDTMLPASGSQGANPRSFIGAILSDGSFLEQVQFTLASDYGASGAKPSLGTQTVLRGTTINASVPPLLYEDSFGNSINPTNDNAITTGAVARRTCTGYFVDGTAIAGGTANYVFVINADTTLHFTWETDYALDVRNNLTGSQGGLTSLAAGNPDPIVKKNWVPDGTISTAFIDGVINSPNANEFGTRYRSTGYQGSGSVYNVASQAIQLDGGNEYVDVGALPAVSFANGITFEALVRYDRFSFYGGICEFASSSGSDVIFLANRDTSSDLQFRIYQGLSPSTSAALNVPGVLQTGVWTHVAFTLDPAGLATVYVNGKVQGTQNFGAGKLPLSVIRDRSYLGYGPKSQLSYFPGKMAEVRLWNQPRTAAQINASMAAALSGTEAGLVRYWKLDNVSGPNGSGQFTTSDASPANAAAVLVNGDPSNLQRGSFSFFQTWASVQSRQQVPQFLMSGPAVIEFGWVKENRILLGSVPSSTATLPVTIGGGYTINGTGELWFTNGTGPIRMSAPQKAGSKQLQSFIGGNGDVAVATGSGTSAGDGTVYYQIDRLTQGSSLTWNYGNRIYQGQVTIGNPLDFSPTGTFTGTEAITNLNAYNIVNPPISTSLISNTPAGSSIDDMRIWDDFADKVFPLRPGAILMEWPSLSGGDPLLTQIAISFPAVTNATFNHIANTPPVQLNANNTDSTHFIGLKYSENARATATDAGEFSVQDPNLSGQFWSVLLFSETTNGTPANGTLTQERLVVRTVRTRKWDDGLGKATATIGSPIVSSLHSTNAPFNGYIYWDKARYNAQIHDRTSHVGPIIPVNQYFGTDNSNQLVVVWYTNALGAYWPYSAVQYSNVWPTSGNRIVIASRLGSDGLDSASNAQFPYDVTRYSRVQIYSQPDSTLPGYNPNEEHALISPSLFYASAATPPPTAFALRNNLNVTNQDATYTSDPYVLVQYYDQVAQQYGMSAYQVQVQDVNVPYRRVPFPATGTNSFGAYLSIGAGGVIEFNLANFVQSFGTNEAVLLEENDNLLGVDSGLFYVVRSNDSKFFLSAARGGAPLTITTITPSDNPVLYITRAYPYTFEYAMKAGEPVVAPYPLQQVIGLTPCAATVGQNLDPNQVVYWEDHKGQPWAISGSTNLGSGLRAQFYYPLQPGFFYPGTIALGTCVPFISNSAPIWVTNHVTWPSRVPVLKGGETLTFSGGEVNADNGNAPGLPGVLGWAAGKVIYDDANPALDGSRTLTNYLGRIVNPLLTIKIPLPSLLLPADVQPASGNVTVTGTSWTFNKLASSLNPRVFYDQANQTLNVRGFVNGKTIGDSTLTASPGSIYVLQPNILTVADSNALVSVTASPTPDWINAVSNLVRLSRDPGRLATNFTGTPLLYGIGLEPARGTNNSVLPNQARHAGQFGPGLAFVPNQSVLSTNGPEGYVTLAENDDHALGAAPIAVHIVRIKKQPPLRGAIKTINPVNPFDEKLTLRHSGDFGGNSGDLIFEWWYRPDDGVSVGPPDVSLPAWQIFPDASANGGLGMQEISVAGNSAATLSDNRFFVHYRHKNGTTNWSDWAGAANSRPPGLGESPTNTFVAQLAEGWVKRVLAAINPFDARIQDFRNGGAPSTYASMVQQAGSPYRGPVALNSDPNVIQNTGLIEFYTTVVNRAKDLSINLSSPVSTPAVNNAILLAASKNADLYLMLGNEAYSDSQDPTIGFGTSSSQYGVLAPTIFCFQNQLASLLDEELALLRGRDSEGAYPAFNRLLWNFTRGEGEAAYALSYNIADQNQDGFINEADARIMFPQGHGDAWGHYLSSVRVYYDLLRHPAYNWQARSESLAIEGVVVSVDYLDERKFAKAAAAKAKAGGDIANLTYRSRYTDNPDGQWQGYRDTDSTRGWGVTEWTRRTGTGALFDWVTANAILPAADTNHVGIEKVDRSTVKELAEISSQAIEIRKQLDNANIGLNPVGLGSDTVPFDIDPTGFGPNASAPATHFEQVYSRATQALQNALDMFNHANELNNMLRQVQETSDQFAKDAAAQDQDYANRLIEIFGTPYSGVIGAGQAYPAGYKGADLYLYMYVDTTGLESVPPSTTNYSAIFQPMKGGFVNTGAPGGGGSTIAEVFSHYFPGDVADVTFDSKTNIDFGSGTDLKLNLPMTTKDYAFQAPAEWGTRSAPGQIQESLAELVQAEADLRLSLNDYDGVIEELKHMTDLIRAKSGVQSGTLIAKYAGAATAVAFTTAIGVASGVAAAFAEKADELKETSTDVAEAQPRVGGVAVDITAPLRSAIMLSGTAAATSAKAVSYAAERTAFALESAKEVNDIAQDIAIQTMDFKYEIQEQLKEFELKLGDEAKVRIEIFRNQENLRTISGKYRALLQSGLRLLDERERHNKETAGAVQQLRYQDFTFRNFRNEALSKYRAAFDLAARYAYLAAKAYDYETNLDPNDPASARPLLDRIIQARTLGVIDSGGPRLGSGGLADVLATMNANFAVLKTQMGFNNPQGESSQFSLRAGLYRIQSGNDASWRQQLESSRVADLWKVPEFRRYCRPFAPETAGAQPGLVISFGSQIMFGKNFFGLPLGPGDSAYDPTLFATKISSVGVWFDNYAGEGLASTPRVYLVPAGIDVMLVPNSSSLAMREWNVVDQKIPVPLPVSQGNLVDPKYIPIKDSLNGTIADIRRYSSFRAFHDAGFTPDQMSFDSRLVARSVWNTRWLLIIPGGTFLANQTDGLDTFIYGLKSPGGPVVDSTGVTRDGNGVKDIKLSFQTYAISGN